MTTILKLLAKVFLLPGDIVRRKVGMSVEEDGGMLRSIVNMIVWGTFALLVWLAFLA